MGYYPDMSSQAAAQGFFADLVQTALARSPSVQRYTGVPLFVDVGVVTIVGSGSASPQVNLGGRGIMAVLATWNFGATGLTTPPRVTTSGAGFAIFNDNTTQSNCFWLALAA